MPIPFGAINCEQSAEPWLAAGSPVIVDPETGAVDLPGLKVFPHLAKHHDPAALESAGYGRIQTSYEGSGEDPFGGGAAPCGLTLYSRSRLKSASASVSPPVEVEGEIVSGSIKTEVWSGCTCSSLNGFCNPGCPPGQFCRAPFVTTYSGEISFELQESANSTDSSKFLVRVQTSNTTSSDSEQFPSGCFPTFAAACDSYNCEGIIKDLEYFNSSEISAAVSGALAGASFGDWAPGGLPSAQNFIPSKFTSETEFVLAGVCAGARYRIYLAVYSSEGLADPLIVEQTATVADSEQGYMVLPPVIFQASEAPDDDYLNASSAAVSMVPVP